LGDAETLTLATGAWKDPATRNRLKIDWQIFAREKYRRIARTHPAHAR
jgi:hypothetical protein